MQYTENYQFRKPVIGIDVADVKDINFNSDRADTLIHNTQISLAPAYDLTKTYDTGDVVMYETLMYKCKADNTTGAWDASKWERTTAGEEGAGGGGTSVVPNPSGTPTDTLETIEIDGTVYDIAWSGGGSSESIKIESIWQGTANQTGVDYTTNKSIEDYDYLIFKFRPVDLTSGTDETELFIRDVNDLTDYGTDTFACIYFQNAYVRGAFSDDTTFSFSIISYQGATAIILYEIQGVKLNGGSSGGSAYRETTLWSGTDSATMQLSESFENYDAIMLVGKNTYNNVDYSISGIWLTSYLKAHINDDMRFGLTNDSWYVYFSITNDTTFERQDQYSLYISEIKGLKLGGGASANKEVNNIWNYVDDNSGNIYWGGNAITLNDDINDYDEIVVEIVSAIEDLSDSWKSSFQWRLTPEILANAIEPYTFTICSYSQRSAKFEFTSTTLQKLMGNNQENGVINVYGIKYGVSAGNSGGYSETSLYTYTGNTRQTTLSLSDNYTDYDAIEFTFGWNLGGDEFETVNVITSSKIVSNVFVNVGGEGRYNYISRGSADNEIILATATGSWDGSSIIREVRGINY